MTRRTSLMPAITLAVVVAGCGLLGGDGSDDATVRPDDETVESPSPDEPVSETPSDRPSSETPSDDLADSSSPELFLTIDAPTNGEVVESEWYDFRGRTTPGARVTAADGSIDVPVDDDGTWQIRLRLNAGSNVATIVAVDAAGGRVVEQVQIKLEVDIDQPPPFSP